MLTLGWVFSGVVKIDQNRRGIYERFGRPITVLGPGLHIVLPRPFGQVRLTEFGTIRSLVLTDNADAAKAAVDTATAEGDPPDSANRLWDNSPEDATCLVARTAEGGGGFEMLTVNLRILYRVRQSDQGAMDALYNVSSPDALLRSLAHRELVRFFASETLEGVMATRRDTMADIMARHVQQELDRHKAGIEIVAVVVDSIQPPAAAAQSWRAVQAAEVKAQMSVAEERARAMGTAALARRDAYTQQASALAQAASIRMEAQANATRMIGDDRSWQTGGRAFLLERYLGGLKAALDGTAMAVLDSRLPNSFLDLRDGAPVSSPSVDDVMAK
nr:SPFH domain-containing protein [Acetobacter estunensis]